MARPPRNVASRLAAKVEAGQIEADPSQASVARALDACGRAMLNAPTGLLGVFAKGPPPRGLYLWGGVGRGKSMLMDMFFDSMPIRRKKRVHFHAFMAGRHRLMKRLRDNPRRHLDNDDLIAAAAEDIADETRLLCFDEMQVTDIGDAMILGRLFERLFAARVVVVTTSNRAPADLYKNGINRDLFLPFIDLLEARMDVHELGAGRDYRLEFLLGAPGFFVPADMAAHAAIDSAWMRLTFGAEIRPFMLDILGREVVVERACAGCARFSFAELCDVPLGPSDYLAIADCFHTVFIDDIPVLPPEKAEAARRFVTLVDALYERRTKLVASADAEPQDLFPAGTGVFEFARTASRLAEMRSAEYLARPRFTADDARAIAET